MNKKTKLNLQALRDKIKSYYKEIIQNTIDRIVFSEDGQYADVYFKTSERPKTTLHVGLDREKLNEISLS
jgi:hypothetical protein